MAATAGRMAAHHHQHHVHHSQQYAGQQQQQQQQHALPVQAAPAGLAPMSQEGHAAAEFTHLCTTFADCVEALPPSITRSVSDLRELDAVLSGSLATITEKLNALLAMLESGSDSTAKPEERLILLKEIAEEARSFRLGGEDKIRVATGTCETLIHHTNQLDVLAHLLATLLPASMAGTMPPPSWPHGYPVLFPTQASASGSAYRKPDYLPSSSSAAAAAGPGQHHHMPANMHVTTALTHGRHTALHHQAHASAFGGHMSAQPGLGGGSYMPARHAQVHDAAADAVRGYVREGGVNYPDPAYIHSQVQKQLQVGSYASSSSGQQGGTGSQKKQRQGGSAAGNGTGTGKGRGGRSNAPAIPASIGLYAHSSTNPASSGYASPNPALGDQAAARGRPGYDAASSSSANHHHHHARGGGGAEQHPGIPPPAVLSAGSVTLAAHPSLQGIAHGSSARDDSPGNHSRQRGQQQDESWIPYANQPPRAGASNKAEEHSHHHHHHHSAVPGPHHHHHHAQHRDSSTSTAGGGGGTGGHKRRRASNRDNNNNVNSGNEYGDEASYAAAAGGGGELGAPSGLQTTGILGRERQNSGHRGGGNGTMGLASPTVSHAHAHAHGQQNKRSRTSSKKQNNQDSPDPGSPYYATATNGNGRASAAAGQTARRKASQMLADPVYGSSSRGGRSAGAFADEHDEADDDELLIGGGEASRLPYEEHDVDADAVLLAAGDEEADGEADVEDTRTYCYCDRVSFGDMIGCDGEDCKREWFHLACVGLETPPRGEWYCDECAAKLGKPAGAATAKKRR